MQLCLKLASFCLLEDPAPTLLSQEATGTQAPVAGVALRGPLSGDMVASCLALWFSSTLWAPSPQMKAGGFSGDYNKNRTLNRHACKMLNVFIPSVRGNLHVCECALSCVTPVFRGWLSPKPRARIGMSQKRKCIHFYFYILPKGMLIWWNHHSAIWSEQHTRRNFSIHKHDRCMFSSFISPPPLGPIHFVGRKAEGDLSSCQNACTESF